MAQFEQAPTDGIEKYRDIADDFMRRIFEMEPEEYLITDESWLSDFWTCFDDGPDLNDRDSARSAAIPQLLAKVQSLYGDVVQKDTDYLITIFRRIAEGGNQAML